MHGRGGKMYVYCIYMCVCVDIAGEEYWRTAQDGASLWFRSVQGYHYWPPAVFPWPLVHEFRPITPKWLLSEPNWDGRDRVQGIPCGDTEACNTQTNIHTPFVAYITPHLLLLILPHGKRRRMGGGGGRGMNKKKTNRAVEPGVDKKKPAGSFSGMSTPYASFSCLKRSLPCLTVNQVR